MQIASKALTDQDRQQICRAVADAESRTAAEIVPVVATCSGRYDRSEDIVGLFMGLIAMGVLWTLWPQSLPEQGDWGGWPEWIRLAALIASVLVGFMLGAIVASRVGWLKRLCTPRAMLRDETQSRARHAFFDMRVHHTTGGSGLLLYVSLLEHQAVVLADAAMVERLGQPALDAFCDQLTERLRSDGLTAAFCATIQSAGEQLATAFPQQSEDVNELPDALVILDEPL